MPVRPGLTASVNLNVSDADTAIAMRSGDVAVVATPRLVALFEEAAVLAVHAELDPGTSTVGVTVQMEHVAPVAVGGQVAAEATLDRVEGRRLSFRVSARDDRGLVAAGKVTRVIVDIEKFLDKTR
ncbi:MAG: thioesterase family protein [Actinomycetes bacterium]